MKTFSITMTVSVNVTVEANSIKEAKMIAMGTPLQHVSEFDRVVNRVEDITPVQRAVRRGVGSY